MDKIYSMRLFGFDITWDGWGKQKNGSYFYPMNGISSRMVGSKGEDWINVDLPTKVYNEIPQLNTVINRLAAMHSNVCWRVYDKTGKEIEPTDPRFTELFKLLKKPNPLQSQNTFIQERVIQYSLFGNQFIYKNKPTRVQDFPSALWNISPAYVAPFRSGKIYDQTDIKEIIPYYVYEDGTTSKKYETETILHSRTSLNPNDPIMGTCPLLSISMPLSNLRATYKFLNKAYTGMGAMGLLSAKGKNGQEGAPALLPKEKLRITEEHLKDYGIDGSQMGLFITEAGLEYTKMGAPVKEMMPFDNLDSNFMAVCDNYGTDIKIFSTKGTKFDEKILALVATYQDTVQPQSDVFSQDLTGFVMPELYDGFYITGEFSHVSLLKEARKKGQQGFKAMADALSTLVEKGVISAADARDVILTELQSLVSA